MNDESFGTPLIVLCLRRLSGIVFFWRAKNAKVTQQLKLASNVLGSFNIVLHI